MGLILIYVFIDRRIRSKEPTDRRNLNNTNTQPTHSGWDLRAEKKAIADFAYDFAALASGLHHHTAAPTTTNGSDGATTGATGAGGGNGGKGSPSLMDSFLPQVTARLRLVDPVCVACVVLWMDISLYAYKVLYKVHVYV